MYVQLYNVVCEFILADKIVFVSKTIVLLPYHIQLLYILYSRRGFIIARPDILLRKNITTNLASK